MLKRVNNALTIHSSVYVNYHQYDSSNDMINIKFVQFVSKYKVVNNELKNLLENVVPRIFPTYSPNSKGPKLWPLLQISTIEI